MVFFLHVDPRLGGTQLLVETRDLLLLLVDGPIPVVLGRFGARLAAGQPLEPFVLQLGSPVGQVGRVDVFPAKQGSELSSCAAVRFLEDARLVLGSAVSGLVGTGGP